MSKSDPDGPGSNLWDVIQVAFQYWYLPAILLVVCLIYFGVFTPDDILGWIRGFFDAVRGR